MIQNFQLYQITRQFYHEWILNFIKVFFPQSIEVNSTQFYLLLRTSNTYTHVKMLTQLEGFKVLPAFVFGVLWLHIHRHATTISLMLKYCFLGIFCFWDFSKGGLINVWTPWIKYVMFWWKGNFSFKIYQVSASSALVV